MTPLLSVVMPVFNGEKYLREAVESILAQTFTKFELIAVDDGSTDSTLAILSAYQDKRIKIVSEGKIGFVAAVNRGVAQAKADWIARHDADDVSLPLRLEEQWRAVQSTGTAVLAYPNTSVIGGTSKNRAWLPRTHALVALKSCLHHPVCIGASLIKKSAFLQVGGYRQEEFPAEDYAFLSRLLSVGSFVPANGAVYLIRKHSEQISSVRLQSQLAKTEEIALANCRRFLRLDSYQAERALKILRADGSDSSVSEWFWLMGVCLPRMPWQSLEMWAWASSQIVRRISSNF